MIDVSKEKKTDKERLSLTVVVLLELPFHDEIKIHILLLLILVYTLPGVAEKVCANDCSEMLNGDWNVLLLLGYLLGH